MKAKQLLKNLYNLSHNVIWEIEANREVEGKSFIKPYDLERITKLIDNISNDVEKTISQTREETIKEMEWEIENWEIVDGKSFTSDKIKDILNKLKK